MGLVWLSNSRVTSPDPLTKSLLIPCPSTLGMLVQSKYSFPCLTDDFTKTPRQESLHDGSSALRAKPMPASRDVQSPTRWHRFLLEMWKWIWSGTYCRHVQEGLRSPKGDTSALRGPEPFPCLPASIWLDAGDCLGTSTISPPTPRPAPPPAKFAFGKGICFPVYPGAPGFSLKCQSVANQAFICQVGRVARNDLPPPCVI